MKKRPEPRRDSGLVAQIKRFLVADHERSFTSGRGYTPQDHQSESFEGVRSCRKRYVFLDLVKVNLTCLELEFADCASGRTISVAWACRAKYKRVQECMLQL